MPHQDIAALQPFTVRHSSMETLEHFPELSFGDPDGAVIGSHVNVAGPAVIGNCLATSKSTIVTA